MKRLRVRILILALFAALASTYCSDMILDQDTTSKTKTMSLLPLLIGDNSKILYVIYYSSNSVTYFNTATGDYINGTLANSSFTTGAGPTGLAVSQ